MRKPAMHWRSLWLGCLFLSGCAQVHIQRITPLNDDTADGLRFYRPRPYLVLNKQVPVAAGDFIVRGYTTPDDNVVFIDPRDVPACLANYFPRATSSNAQAATTIHNNLNLSENTSTVGVPFDVVTEPASAAPQTMSALGSSPGGPTAPTTRATTQQSPTTQATFAASEDGDPLLKLNDLFSITYLPDFSENYVVSVDPGLQQGSADVAMKYGWMIEHAKWDVDNSQIGQFLSSQIETAETVGLSILNPIAGAASASAPLSELAKGNNSNANPKAPIEHEVLLRVRYVIEAEPGVYPILKPQECEATWWTPGAHPVGLAGSRTLDAEPKALTGTNPDAADADTIPVMLPIPPYTIAAFNYQRTISIELVNGAPNSPPAKEPK